MGVESTNLSNIYVEPQKYTAQNQTKQTSPVETSTASADLVRTPEKDSFQKTSAETKPALTNKQKGLIAGAVALIGGVTIFVVTKGKNNKITKELAAKAAKKAEEEAVKEAEKKAARIAAEEVTKKTEVKAAEEAKLKVIKDAEAKVVEEAKLKAANEAEAKLAEEAKKAEEMATKKAEETIKQNMEAAKLNFKSSLQEHTDEEIMKIKDDLFKQRSEITQEAHKIYIENKGYEAPNLAEALEKLPKQKFNEYKLLQDKTSICSLELDARYNKQITGAIARKGDKEVISKPAREWATQEERGALGRYYDMYPNNQDLRKGADPSKIKDVVLLDKAFERAPALADDAVVYRAVHGAPEELRDISLFKGQQEFVDSIKPGQIIDDASFVSTSTRADSAQFKQFIDAENGGVMMRINLPKGTKGINGGYYEYVLPRGSKIKVNSLETINGHKVADCTYILPETN